MKMSTTDWLMLVVLSGLWGLSFFLIEIALTSLPVLTLVALRISIAAIVLWLYVWLRGARVPTSMSVWRAFVIMGVLNNILPFSLIVWGQTEITSSLASILNATTPLFAVLVAAVWLHDEPVTRSKVAGMLLGFTGVVVMIGADTLAEVGADVAAQVAVVIASLCYALASAYGRRFAALGIAPSVSAACQVTMSSIMLAAFITVTGGWADFGSVTAASWSAVVVLAVVSTALAYVLYFRLLASAGATNLMLVTFLIPVMAITLGILLLDETLRPTDVAGMAMIFVALVVIDGRVFSLRRRPI